MSLRDYLVYLRTEDETIKKAYERRKNGDTLKSIMSEEWIEYCHSLELSNRNMATILNCSAGTVGTYVASYVRLRFDDIVFEKVNYTEEIMQYKTGGLDIPIFDEQENVFLLLSDTQAGALVTSSGYDTNPAKTIDTYFELLLDRIVESLIKRRIKVNNFNIIMLGDLLDGWQKFANQQVLPIRAQKEVLVKNILKLIKNISASLQPDKINIYGVWGNHGIIDKFYPSSDNWDTIVMEEVETHLGYLKELDKDFACVTSFISDEETQLHDIGFHRYYILHGHQFRGFSAETWKKGLNKAHVSRGGFDAALMGHWHTFHWMSNNGMQILVNGCTYRSPFVQDKLQGKEDICQVLFGQNEYEPIAWVDKLNVDQGFELDDN